MVGSWCGVGAKVREQASVVIGITRVLPRREAGAGRSLVSILFFYDTGGEYAPCTAVGALAATALRIYL